MDIKYKKTKLDDDSVMYDKSKDTVTKEELKNLPFKKKVQYFMDYYAKIVVVAIIAVVALFSLLNTMVFNRSTCRLSLVFLNTCQTSDTETLTDTLSEYLVLGNKNDYVSAENFNTEDYQMNMTYVTRIGAGSVDLVVCSREDFKNEAEKGYFADLTTVLPEELYESLSGQILDGQTAETDNEGNVISYSEPMPMGIDVSDSSFLTEYTAYCKDPVLCVLANAPNPENAIKVVSYVTGK